MVSFLQRFNCVMCVVYVHCWLEQPCQASFTVLLWVISSCNFCTEHLPDGSSWKGVTIFAAINTLICIIIHCTKWELMMDAWTHCRLLCTESAAGPKKIYQVLCPPYWGHIGEHVYPGLSGRQAGDCLKWVLSDSCYFSTFVLLLRQGLFLYCCLFKTEETRTFQGG